MKKFMKIFACAAMALIVPFGLVGCDKEQLEENTKTVIESGATIIPVEYKQETAEAILKSSLQKLLSSNQVQIMGTQYVIDDGLYSDGVYEQKILIQNGKRYVYFNFDGINEVVMGEYDGKSMALDIERKLFYDLTKEEPAEPGNPEAEVVPVVSQVTRLDLVTNMVELSESVVAGRYFDGATYINVETEEYGIKNSVEFKIVDGYIVSMTTLMQDDSGNATGWAMTTISYGAAVDTSVIPTSIVGYTNGMNPAE